MTSSIMAELTDGISPIDESWLARARAHLDTLTKPLGSLGRLEELAAQIVSIRSGATAKPVGAPLHKAVYVFAADHGITAEGVSAYPSAVTQQMMHNFLGGGAAVNVLARLHGVDLHLVDMGVNAEFDAAPGLLHRKVAGGTANMLHQPAMTEEQLAQALLAGAALGEEAARAGVTLLAIGEMGIGNTTSASVITCALTGAHPALATGSGTGLDSQARERKVNIVQGVLDKHFSKQPPPSAIDILRCGGGLEIAGMVGMVLAAARHRLAIVVDGFISSAAAALAVALEPHVRGYLIAGHRSQEPGHAILLEFLGLNPVLALEMRLGEGSGAVLAMPVIESAIALYAEMATFASAGVSEANK